MTIPLLSTVDVPCPDCNGTGHSLDTADRFCPRCEGRGTVSVLFFTCPTCEGVGIKPFRWTGGSAARPYAIPCDDPNHSLHGPVTLARLSQVAPMWFTEKGRQIEAVFRKVAEWQAP